MTRETSRSSPTAARGRCTPTPWRRSWAPSRCSYRLRPGCSAPSETSSPISATSSRRPTSVSSPTPIRPGRRHPGRARRAGERVARRRAHRERHAASPMRPTCATTGQGYEIPVSLDPDEVRNGLGDLEERFNVLHEQLYGFRMNETEAEIVNLRAIGFGSVPKPELPTGTLGPGTGPAPSSTSTPSSSAARRCRRRSTTARSSLPA